MKSVIEALEKMDDKILLMVETSLTITRCEGTKIVKLFLSGFQIGEEIGDGERALLQHINLFLELCNTHKIALRKVFSQIIPNTNSPVQINNTLHNRR